MTVCNVAYSTLDGDSSCRGEGAGAYRGSDPRALNAAHHDAAHHNAAHGDSNNRTNGCTHSSLLGPHTQPYTSSHTQPYTQPYTQPQCPSDAQPNAPTLYTAYRGPHTTTYTRTDTPTYPRANRRRPHCFPVSPPFRPAQPRPDPQPNRILSRLPDAIAFALPNACSKCC